MLSAVLILTTMILVYYNYPSFIVLAAGMGPTGIAWLTDVRKSKALTKAIGSMNFAGTFYILLKLWMGQNNFSFAMELLSTLSTWLITFSLAGVGLIIFLIIPPIVETYIYSSLQFRLRRNYELKKMLEEEWGKEISVEAEMEALTVIEGESAESEANHQKNRQREKKRAELEKLAREDVRKSRLTNKLAGRDSAPKMRR